MKRRSRQDIVFEFAPLIDVVFLLLIFFMTATVFKSNDLALLLNLPKTKKTGEKTYSKESKIIIEVSRTQIAINGEHTSLDQLETKLKDIDDKKVAIDLRIDKDVRYSRVTTILEILQQNNLINLRLITEDNNQAN